jgi:hypothetical protein
LPSSQLRLLVALLLLLLVVALLLVVVALLLLVVVALLLVLPTSQAVPQCASYHRMRVSVLSAVP